MKATSVRFVTLHATSSNLQPINPHLLFARQTPVKLNISHSLLDCISPPRPLSISAFLPFDVARWSLLLFIVNKAILHLKIAKRAKSALKYTLMSKKISERLISSLTYQSYLLDSSVNITDTDFVAFRSSGASNRLIRFPRLLQMSICPCKVYTHELKA